MKRHLVFVCFVASFLVATIAQSQPCTKLYNYDTLVVGVKGSGMTLSASVPASTFTPSCSASWVDLTQESGKIKIEITETNTTLVERIGYIYVNHGAACQDVIVLLQPGKTCDKGTEGTAGKKFWVSFLENITSQEGSANKFKLELIATSDQNASGTVTNPRTSYQSTFSIVANTVSSLPITTTTLSQQAYNSTGESINNKALYVETDANITLYANNYEEKSSDATNILPIEALGDEYYSISYNSNISGPATPEEFLIVATEDKTLVTIIPASETGGTSGSINSKKANDPFLIKLNKGQTYLVKAYLGGGIVNNYFYKSITGTYIKANKNIAVFAGHKRAKVPSSTYSCSSPDNSRDNLYQQLLPLRLWGNRYAVTSTGQPEDLYRIVSAYDSTIFKINGVTQAPLHRGQYRDYFIKKDTYAFIESETNPIEIAQFGVTQDCINANVGDPYMVIINLVENQITDITFTPIPSSVIENHYITILVNKDSKSQTQLVNKQTGNPVSLTFKDISGYDYSYATANIDPVTHSIRNDNGFIANVFGYGNAESYAYSVGARFNTLEAPSGPTLRDTAYCVNETPRQFELDSSKKYIWYDSENDDVGSDTIPLISTNTPGTYIFRVSQEVDCSVSPPRKIVIRVKDYANIIFDTTVVCRSMEAIEIATPRGGTYTTGPGCVGGSFYPYLAGVGTHIITYAYEDYDTCLDSASATITVLPPPGTPVITANDTTKFCRGSSVILSTSGTATGYQWYKNDSLLFGATAQSYTVTETGTYTLCVQDTSLCWSNPSNPIEVTVYELPANPVISPLGPIRLCDGQSSTLTVQSADALTYQWYKSGTAIPGATGNQYVVTTSGSYSVEVFSDGNCPPLKASDTVAVHVDVLPDDPVLTALSDTEFCEGESILLVAVSANATHFEWFRNGTLLPGTSSSSCVVYASGTYVVKAIGAGNCDATNQSNAIVVTVHPLPANPIISPAGPLVVCEGKTAKLTAESEGALTFQWYYNGTPLPGGIASTITIHQSGSYTVAVQGAGGCLAQQPSNTVTLSITSLPGNPTLVALSATDFCQGMSVDLLAKSIDAENFEWYRDSTRLYDATGDTYTAYDMGNYWVKAFGAGDCYADNISNEVRVIVRANPVVPVIISSAGPPFYLGIDYTLFVDFVEPGVLYEWYKDDIFTSIYGERYFLPVLKESDAGIFFVEASNEYCRKRSQDFVLAPIEMPDLFIPNVYTPNGDGINDNFRIVGLEAFVENELTVVNKRGKLVYSKKNYDNSWYGEGQPDDIYYYVFKATTKEDAKIEHKGYVYIKRAK